MRLLYVTPTRGDQGGVRRSCARMVDAMRGAGHDVACAIPDRALFPGDVRARPGEVRFGIVEPVEPETWTDVVARLARDHAADVIVGYYGSSGGAAAAHAGWTAGIPSVVALRGNDVDRDLDDGERGPRVRAAIAAAAAVTTVSTEMARKVRAATGVRARYISNSVDTRRFYAEPDSGARFRRSRGLTGRPVLGVFGELKPKRGLDVLRAVGAELARWHVLLIGTARADVRHLIDPSWRRIPHLDSDAELRAAYAACDVVAQPSHRDGMPNVVLEAMACERTVVASRAGGLPDLLDHDANGLLVDGAPEIAVTLASLRACPRPQLGAAARRSVPRIDDERRAFEAVFASVAMSRRGRQRAIRR